MTKIGKQISVILLICILMIGCGKATEPIQTEENISKEELMEEELNEQEGKQDLLEIEKREEVTAMEEVEEVYEGNLDIPIDYDFLNENHAILEYNICTSPQSVYDHSILKEFLKEDLEREKEFIKRFNSPAAENDYFIEASCIVVANYAYYDVILP